MSVYSAFDSTIILEYVHACAYVRACRSFVCAQPGSVCARATVCVCMPMDSTFDTVIALVYVRACVLACARVSSVYMRAVCVCAPLCVIVCVGGLTFDSAITRVCVCMCVCVRVRVVHFYACCVCVCRSVHAPVLVTSVFVGVRGSIPQSTRNIKKD